MKARFIPQVWQNDYAVSVIEAPDTWDVTPEFYDATFPDQTPEFHSYESDLLRDDPAAPEWVSLWPGPFEVELIDDDDDDDDDDEEVS